MAACVCAAAVLITATATTTAGKLSLNTRTFRATWTNLEWVAKSFLGTETVRCPVTMEGSFHSATIQKTRSALIGHVTKATSFSARCTGGTFSVLQETLPWHVTYESFAGNLPNISAVFLLLIGMSFRITSNSGLRCLARSEPNHNLTLRATLDGTGVITSLEPAANELPLTGGFPCELGNGSLLPSRSTVAVLNSSTRLIVRLI